MGAKHSKTLYSFLETKTVGDLIESENSGGFIKIQQTHSIGEGLAILNNRGNAASVVPPLTSAPVWSDTFKADVGVFSVRDVVAMLYDVDQGFLDRGDIESIRDAWYSMGVEAAMKAGQVHSENSTGILPFKRSARLHDVIATMAKTRSHRIAVTDDETDHIQFLLSQSVMVRFLEKHMHELKHERANLSLRQLKVGYVRHLIHVRESDPIYKAFKLCGKYSISSVIVLNKEGAMTNSVSVSNIRVIDENSKLPQLLWPTSKFLAHHKLHQADCVHLDTSFTDTVTAMAKRQLHRIFIVEAPHADRPGLRCVGVVTLADVLAEIFTQEFWSH